MKELITERRKEVEFLQKEEKARLKNLEDGRSTKIEELKLILDDDPLEIIKKLDKVYNDEKIKTNKMVKEIKAKIDEQTGIDIFINDLSNGIKYDIGPLFPFYVVIHGTDGGVIKQENNPGRLGVKLFAEGGGSGIGGSGASSANAYIDWRFAFHLSGIHVSITAVAFFDEKYHHLHK